MQDKINSLLKDAIARISASDNTSLSALRQHYLGKQGVLSSFAADLPSLPPNKRKDFGTFFNQAKKLITEALDKRELQAKEQLASNLDITRPGHKPTIGHLHPITHIIREAKEIFGSLGFVCVDGPEVELDIYNFQKLRLHKDHPARDSQDTYYVTDDQLLRTHTSNMQVRYMEAHKPPLRAIFPGRVYRRDQIDATHLPGFYQLEGLLVDQNTSMSDLIGTLSYFIERLFGQGREIRIYGHHFPYTEPSIEIEMKHDNGQWMEILGAGMVHPEVLENVDLDPKKYRGWAFGMGPERLAMLKWGITDIRSFYTGDIRFLEQFL